MLTIQIPDKELYIEDKKSGIVSIVNIHGFELYLEHSLLSLTKWEEKHHVPLLKKLQAKEPENRITQSEFIDYIRCMTLNKNVNPEVYKYFKYEDSNPILHKIIAYLDDPHTATPPIEHKKQEGATVRYPDQEDITSEMIYYWMTQLEIPFTCEKWNINRLLRLIDLINDKVRKANEKASPKAPKMPKAEFYKRQSAANTARRAKLHSKG